MNPYGVLESFAMVFEADFFRVFLEVVFESGRFGGVFSTQFGAEIGVLGEVLRELWENCRKIWENSLYEKLRLSFLGGCTHRDMSAMS